MFSFCLRAPCVTDVPLLSPSSESFARVLSHYLLQRRHVLTGSPRRKAAGFPNPSQAINAQYEEAFGKVLFAVVTRWWLNFLIMRFLSSWCVYWVCRRGPVFWRSWLSPPRRFLVQMRPWWRSQIFEPGKSTPFPRGSAGWTCPFVFPALG